MNTIGVLLLAAATATSGIGKPHVGGKRFLRHHAAIHGAPPASGMIDPNLGGGDGGAGGALGATGARRFPNVRSQIFFVDPPGMQIGWQTAAGGGDRVYLPAQLFVPARYNFTQGYIYRLKLTAIPGRPSLSLYPTIEVAPSTPATDAYLTHNPIPVQFTEEDFDQVQAGNFVTKVIYLPDPKYQELAVSGVETLVSTRLEPGVDPILEADRRGTILLIVRLGGIDLEMPAGGSAVVGGDSAPLGPSPAPFVPPAGTTVPSEDVDPPAAPVTPAPAVPAIPDGDVPAAPAPAAPGSISGLLPVAEPPALYPASATR
jgi:hypothetical protein